ncbi:MAG: TonB-dependent receptor plug domain-containing protein, partial [Gracilimonas sp.]
MKMNNMVIENIRKLHSGKPMLSINNNNNLSNGISIILIVLISMLFSVSLIAQDKSQPFTSTLNADEIEQYGDFTVEEAIARIPGVQVDRDGNINLRGVGQNNYYVTVNGQRMGTTGLGERSVDLSIIPVELVNKIEFVKVLTADMDADGLAGVINIITNQPDSSRTVVTGGIGGGFTTNNYENQVGPTGRAWVGYSAPLSDVFSIAMKVNYQRDDLGRQSLGMDYGVQDFGSGNVDVLERLSPGLQTDLSDRFGGLVNLDFIPSETTSFYLRAMANVDNNSEEGHFTEWRANESWDDQSLTGSGASYGYNLNTRNTEYSQYTFNAGAKHMFNAFTLNYDAGWAQSKVNRDDYLFPFLDTGVEYNVNFDDRERPSTETVDEMPAPEDLRLMEMTYIVNNQINRKITGNVDVEIPISLGTFKLGSSAILTVKDANDLGAYSEYHQTFGLSALYMNDFEKYDQGSVSVFDEDYDLGRLVKSGEAKDFYQSSIPNMRLDNAAYNRDSHIRNYYADEQIYAGYG